MAYNETYRSFLAIVCKHLGLANAAEAIDDFLTTDPKNRQILKDLLGETGSTVVDFFTHSFGALFYKVTVSDRHVFRIPVSYGTTVLRKNHSRVPSTQGSQKSGTDAGTFTVLGVSDPGSPHRGSAPLDPLDRPTTPKTLSFRESVASSHGMTFTTASGETDLGHGLYTQNQFLLVARTYPRDCLFALPLTIANNNEAFTEDRGYIFAIRCNIGPNLPRIKYSSDPMQLFPTNVSIGYLQGSMLDCAHRLFSTVYMRLLAYYTQRKEIYTTTEGSDTGGSKSASKNKSSKTGPGNLTIDGSMHSADDSSTQPSRGGGSGSISGHSRRGTYAGGGGTDDSQRLRDEFSVTLFKFSAVLEETIHALQGVFNLEEPDFMPDENYVIDPSRDYLMIPQISRLLKTWDDQIDAVLAALDRPRPISSGPLEEVDYWRYRCKVLTAVAEALRSKTARWVMNAWVVLNPDTLPYNRGAEIKAQMLEAKDNSRFLLLVERHFKNVQFGSTFDSVTDTIPAMVQSLRLIWTISRGYNKDERMGPLLRRIAWALCDRVICVLEISHLFGQSIRHIMREVRAAIRMLTTFENTYLQERQHVEATSQDNRWEFDRKLLFGDINYMKRILTDIFDMAKCANEFYHMFGPELKNITGDNKTLSEVLRLVDQLFTAMKSQDLPCPFLSKNEKAWLKVKSEFEDNASMIDAKAKNFINDYFAHIRGPTSAFDLLEKFKSVKARAAITCLLKDKYRDVLRSYGNELVKVDLKFKESKDAPAVAHYIPPTAGSISWARLILSTVKASILRFLHSQPDILDEEEGKAVKARYVALAEELRKYEKFRHRNWETEVNAIVSLRLSQPILYKHSTQISYDQNVQAIFPPPTWWAGAKGETGTVLMPPPPPQAQLIRQLTVEQALAQGTMRRTSSTHLQRNHGSAISWTSQGERGSLGTSQQISEGCLPVYEVNFDSKLWGVVQEAARMELFGLPLPEIGRFLGLRYTYYQNMVLQLQSMVDRYEAIRVQLDPLKVSLTETGLKSLVNTIDRGVFYLNWDSLVVDEYLEFCDRKLKRTENHIKEINRCFDILERIGVLISRAQMFKEKEGGQLVSAKEYMDYAEAKRESDMEELANQISTMATSCLGKLEEALYDTNTCRRAEMYPIYQRFEVMILFKLLEVVLRNMWSFVNALGGREPIFYIDVLLVNSDVVLYPVSADLYKWMTQTLRGCVESCRYFLRWKHGTCEPCPSVRSDGDELITFNYVQELERCPELREPDVAFNQRVQHLNRNVLEFLKRLARYSILWHQDKQNVVEKWLHSRTQTTRDFELRVIYLRTRWQSLDRLLGSKRIIYVGAIALRLASFFMNVTTNLRDWIRIYMRYLYESAENLFNQVQKMIVIKRKVLRKRPTSLTEMKELLSVMAEIRGGACEEVDDLLLKISERLRIIKLYADEIPAHMWDCTHTLRRRWNAILSLSAGMAQNVAPFKAHFAVGIAEEIKAFRKKVRAFVESYKISGPGNESEDLDNGCASLAKFVAECELLDARRIDLLSSERLLDLPISAYPELKEMRAELQKLKPIYELYTEQKSARQDWACILWKDAKLSELVAAMRDFSSRFRQRPRRMRALPAAKMLNTTLKNFLESLLLIQNLKDDAMRDRHWKQLMEKTGISFDMDPQTFTLEGVFAMQLHEFADVISTVVNNAQREVIIERNLEEIKNIWLEMKFLLTSYTKCNKEPCYVLGSVDEPTQCMEDHMMSLQSIGASRHATPFLVIVRQWERDLTIVSDTLDLWVVVQQKWMYLEAIFMGGDVAKQLPNEAKRFETIDKMFRKVSESNV
ncbi:hypothetical protein EG68_05470 [Paragonimus skrjabini miyazakii]|uniref:Dynein heavy chain n=1 Tax=Paragonimus skrjabini miyazakii TaxID=59628 RepID=A0A8S9YMN2_9TREM|nr:hypothetical protein EG68_05470 [Paragonimus skrjabini miyazakii]